MKFDKRFYFSTIPEWKDQYLDYAGLCAQIKLIKKAALNLAKAYANIKAITGDQVDMEIQVDHMAADKVFWHMLEDNLQKIEEFYKTQLLQFTEQFHILTLQAIRLNLIVEYEPFTRGLSTRLERELERLSLPGAIELSTLSKKDEAKQPLMKEGTLLHLDRDSRVEDIVERVRRAATYHESHSSDDEGYDDGYSSGRTSPYTSRRDVSVDMGGPDSGYDSDKSEEAVQPDSIRANDSRMATPKPGVQRSRKTRSLSSIKLRPLTADDVNDNRAQGSNEMEMDDMGVLDNMSDSDDMADIPFENSDGFYDDVDLKKPAKQEPRTSTQSRPASRPASTRKVDLKYTVNKLDRDKAGTQLKSAFSEYYRGLILIQNFAALNVEAVEKILKKHDKNIELGARERFVQNQLVQFSFYRRRSLKALMRETEHVYAQCFTGGHRTAAMKVLRVPTERKKVGVATFRFGFFFGFSLGLAMIVIYLSSVIDVRLLDKMRPGLIIYRMLSIAVLMFWMWGVDMWVWTKHRVNYVFIFEFNPRSHTRYQNVFEAASLFTFITMANMVLFMLTAAQDGVFGWDIPGFTWLEGVPPHIIPMLMLVLVISSFVWLQFKSGWWLVRTLGRITAAPWVPVVFRDFFLADQLSSLVIVFQDLQYVICYYVSDAWTGQNVCVQSQAWVFPVIALLPSAFRLLQCLRRYRDSKDSAQLLNAAKYCSGFLVVTTSALRKAFPNGYTDTLWFISIVASTLYTFSWDVLKDWSLGNRGYGVRHKFLRSQLLYPTAWYYMAIVADFAMRCMWTLTISPEAVRGTLHPDVFSAIIAGVEVFRRGVWNVFRLENEQLNNCGKFRALKDIPLPLPLDDPRHEM